MEKHEAAEELMKIKEKMEELLGDAEHIIRQVSDEAGGRMVYDRARLYWVAHINMQLTSDHGYLGGAMVTMEDTIAELENMDDEDDPEEG